MKTGRQPAVGACMRGRLATAALLLACCAAPLAQADDTQRSFASPNEAATALASAWRADSRPALRKLFGADGLKLVSSGDRAAEREARSKLAAAYTMRHTFRTVDAGRVTLVLGADEFPFPIPLVREGARWRFDVQAGAEEILDRRIGRNELDAIDACRAYVEAQLEYAERSGAGIKTYAARLVSTPGRHDGLYWPAAAGQEKSPLGPLFAGLRGYRYTILTRQGKDAHGGAADYEVNGRLTGGFALLAYPARYGNTGIMTFMVNRLGIVFEKDLGPQTATLAQAMSEYNPDPSWHPVGD